MRRLLLALVLLGAPAAGRAQTPGAPPAAPAPVVVPTRPKPLGYFFRSLVVPGWGQAAMDRKLTGGLFIAFEGVALGMALKANHELRYLERTGSGRVEDKRQERQDWFVLLGVNHLLSGLEAYVSANLYDFPGDLRMRRLPDGRTALGVTLPLGPR